MALILENQIIHCQPLTYICQMIFFLFNPEGLTTNYKWIYFLGTNKYKKYLFCLQELLLKSSEENPDLQKHHWLQQCQINFELFQKMEKIECHGNIPLARFGHSITFFGKHKAFLFGGATGDSGQYSITDSSFIFDISNRLWKKLECNILLSDTGTSPSPRAAHAACAIEFNEIVLYGGANGGANGGGCLANDDLFLIDINDDIGIWNIVKVKGSTPGKRYGHTLSFSKPFLVVFGGNTGSEPVNDTWLLNIEKSQLQWIKVNVFGEKPSPRVYHSASVCPSGIATGMIVIFGGRAGNQQSQIALNDTWGLRKHGNGTWDWVKAKNKREQKNPIGRYQHTSLFVSTALFVIGGRTNNVIENLPLQVYDVQSSDWTSFNSIQRFRHGSWFVDKSIYIYGGFEPQLPNVPTDVILKINLLKLLQFKQNLMHKLLVEARPRTPINSTPIIKAQQKLSRSRNSNRKYVVVEPVIGKQQSYTKRNKQNQINSIADWFLQSLCQPKLYYNVNEAIRFNYKREHLMSLCDQVENIFKEQPIILKVNTPLKIFGDIHGQYSDLMSFFNLYGSPYDNGRDGDIQGFDYIFLGDFVDRGINSLETILLLFSLKVKYPKEIHLIRGNHQDRWINCGFGFSQQCAMKLNQDVNEQDSFYNRINRVFQYLPLGAIIQNKILCLHGGIGVSLNSVQDILKLKRPLSVIHQVTTQEEQLIVDILWSDPTESDAEYGIIHNEQRDPQRTGNIVKFGPDRVQQFLNNNNLSMIIRAHQCVHDGFERFAGGKLITVFSATDYCGRHKNAGAILIMKKNLQIIPKLIYPSSNNGNNWIEDEETLKKRPPTPPRWKSNGQRKSFD